MGSFFRKNSALVRLLRPAERDLAVHLAGSVRRLLPHVTEPEWHEEEVNKPGAVFADAQKRRLKISVGITRGERRFGVVGFVRRLDPKVTTDRTLDDREKRIAHEIGRLASDVLSRELFASDCVLYERHFDELVVAGYLRARHSLDLPVEKFIRDLRRLAEQTYENKSLAFGCVIGPESQFEVTGSRAFPEDFFRSKKFKALSDGYRTAYLISAKGRLAGYVDLVPNEPLSARESRAWYPDWARGIARQATDENVSICLTRHGDILVFEDGSLRLSYRFGRWQYWNHAHLMHVLDTFCHVPNVPRRIVARVVRGIYRCALDVSFRRTGGLLVSLSAVRSLAEVVRAGDALGSRRRSPAEKEFDSILRNENVYDYSRPMLAELAGLDGAVVLDSKGRFLAYGAVLMTPNSGPASRSEGSRTKAAEAASKHGLAVKISSDGGIVAYSKGRVLFEI